MKRVIALVALTAFAFSVAGSSGLCATGKIEEKPKTECKCGKNCKGESCKCGCHDKEKKKTE